jgi:hypothetical protein
MSHCLHKIHEVSSSPKSLSYTDHRVPQLPPENHVHILSRDCVCHLIEDCQNGHLQKAAKAVTMVTTEVNRLAPKVLTRHPDDLRPMPCMQSPRPPQRPPPGAMHTEPAATLTTSTEPISASPLFSFSKPGTSFVFGFRFNTAPTPSLHPPPPVEVLLSDVLLFHLFPFSFR